MALQRKPVVAGTYGASFMSAGTFLGQIGTNYQTGWVQTWNLCASMFAMFLMAALFTKKIWRVGYLYGVSSMPDLFGLRYPSKVTRGFYSVMILLIYIVGMAAMYIGIFTILSLVTSLSYMQCVIIGAVVVLLYSITGGAKAVAWTDDACMIIMFFSMVVAVFVALVHGGGLVREPAGRHDRLARFQLVRPAVDGRLEQVAVPLREPGQRVG